MTRNAYKTKPQSPDPDPQSPIHGGIVKNIKIKEKSNHGLRGFIFIVCAITAMALAACGGGGDPDPDGPGDGDNITVTFNLGGAPGTPPSDITIKNNTSMGNKYPANPSRPGAFEFAGWYNAGKKYDKGTVISAKTSTFALTAEWNDETIYNAQPPDMHPGNHFQETGGRERVVKVNQEFSVDGLKANVEKDAGVLSAKWYKVTTSQADADAATADSPKGTVILEQDAPPPGHEMSLPFKWSEPAAGTYWYYVIVTNTNNNATVNKTSSKITMDRLKVTVTN